MRHAITRFLLFCALMSLPLVYSCGGGGGGEATHVVDKAGIYHYPGLEDPLRVCVECHGADLRGDTGPSCYNCHSNPPTHTAVFGGVAHNPADISVCGRCHGPNNSGGLGPACATCH